MKSGLCLRSVVLVSVLLALGCEETRKKPEAQQKAEAVRPAVVPKAVRQPREQSELVLEPAGGLGAREAERRLQVALKEKSEADKLADELRKALDEERTARTRDKKELRELRIRLAQPQKRKADAKPQRDEDTMLNLLDLGRELYDKNEFINTRRLLQGLAELGFENADLFFMLGRCHQELGDADAALSEYGRACDILENAAGRSAAHVRVLLNMGVILRAQRRFEDAVAVYERAIKVDPQYASVYYNLALLYEESLKDKGKALAFYEKYIDLRGERYQEAEERAKRLRSLGTRK